MKSTLSVVALAAFCGIAFAQSQPQSPAQKSASAPQAPTGQAQAASLVKPAANVPAASDNSATKGEVLEEIVARVNSDIITTVDLAREKKDSADDARQECADEKCTPEQLQTRIDEGQTDALRNLIDRDLMIQRAKDLDINVETDLVKKLDDIRAENKLDSLEDLQKAIEESGQDYTEYQNELRDHLLEDEVIQREVTDKITSAISHDELMAYYNQHKEDFTVPETVTIREILVSTDGKPESDWPALKKKAESYRDRVLNGEDFTDLARHFSDGSTARQGGELGHYQRGQLTKQVEDIVFTLNRNEMTPVLETKQGYLLIQVEQRYEAGVQPEDKVENEIMGRIVREQGEKKMRIWLDGLRKDSWVEVRPGYTDTGGAGSTSISEAKDTAAELTKPQKKAKKHKRFLIF
jgi:peptidyl-prolyl cis-trans isomerase SurA